METAQTEFPDISFHRQTLNMFYPLKKPSGGEGRSTNLISDSRQKPSSLKPWKHRGHLCLVARNGTNTVFGKELLAEMLPCRMKSQSPIKRPNKPLTLDAQFLLWSKLIKRSLCPTFNFLFTFRPLIYLFNINLLLNLFTTFFFPFTICFNTPNWKLIF